MAGEGGRGSGIGGGIGGGEEAGTPSGGSSPKNRMKLLCSYGGKIMPRPADGLLNLKYIGGETRVIAVPRDINFSELTKKLRTEFEGDSILKYQVMPEDLDVLVSVKTNEDVKHMVDVYDRQQSGGTPKLRAFLFPSKPVVAENNQNSYVDPHAVEQRYIDAVNGTVRTNAKFRPSPIIVNRPTFSISACSSPKSTSPEGKNADYVHQESSSMNSYGRHHRLHKVHSSPCLYSLNTSPKQSGNLSGHNLYQPHHHLYQRHQQHHPIGCQHVRPRHDLHRLAPASSYGRYDLGRSPTGHGITQWHSSRHKIGGSGNSNKYGYLD